MGQIIGVLIGSWLWYRLARWTARNVELTRRFEATAVRFVAIIGLLALASVLLGTDPFVVFITMGAYSVPSALWFWLYARELADEKARVSDGKGTQCTR